MGIIYTTDIAKICWSFSNFDHNNIVYLTTNAITISD